LKQPSILRTLEDISAKLVMSTSSTIIHHTYMHYCFRQDLLCILF